MEDEYDESGIDTCDFKYFVGGDPVSQDELGELFKVEDLDRLIAYCEAHSCTISSYAIRNDADNILRREKDFEQYAWDLLDELYDIPDVVKQFIDAKEWADHVAQDYTICEGYVWRNH